VSGSDNFGTGGGRGIRTPERVSPSTVFKTAAINHSAIPPLTIVPDAFWIYFTRMVSVSDLLFPFASDAVTV
jgi:hypothetical protein